MRLKTSLRLRSANMIVVKFWRIVPIFSPFRFSDRIAWATFLRCSLFFLDKVQWVRDETQGITWHYCHDYTCIFFCLYWFCVLNETYYLLGAHKIFFNLFNFFLFLVYTNFLSLYLSISLSLLPRWFQVQLLWFLLFFIHSHFQLLKVIMLVIALFCIQVYILLFFSDYRILL